MPPDRPDADAATDPPPEPRPALRAEPAFATSRLNDAIALRVVLGCLGYLLLTFAWFGRAGYGYGILAALLLATVVGSALLIVGLCSGAVRRPYPTGGIEQCPLF